MDQTIPNLRHLRAFSEVASRRSISRASERMFLSQPAISQALAKLEERLGADLFDRRSDGMHLTAPGEAFRERVDRALTRLRAGLREVARAGSSGDTRRKPKLDQLVTATQLRALIAVADAHSFSLAARNIGASQPSVHRAARELERILEVQLFEKTSRGFDATRPARALARQAKLAFAELAQGFAEVDASQGRETGIVSVGTLPLARTDLLPAAITALTAANPLVRVSVVDGPYDDLLHRLRHGELDVLVGALRARPLDDVVQQPLFDDPFAVVARHDHPLAGKPVVTRDDLATYPWVVARHGTPIRARFEEIFGARSGTRPSNVVESSSLILIRGMLLRSDSLTILSARQVRYEIELQWLRTLAFDMAHTKRTIGLTLRQGWRPTAVQEQFLALLRAAAGASAAHAAVAPVRPRARA